MASAKDVRDILSLPQRGAPSKPGESSTSGGRASKPKTSKPARPEGISREVYALLGDNAPSLALASSFHTDKRFKPKFQRKETKANKQWVLKKFKNPARKDGLILTHWAQEEKLAPVDQQADASTSQVQLDADKIETDYPYAQFNTHCGVYSYSNDEYLQHLRDEDWSKDETDYLIDICTEYDLRFTVIADRYEWPGKQRSIEDLKARYYAICRRLIRSRISTEDIETRQQLLQTYAFDRNREVERKKAVARLYSRTPAQLAEEEALYVEARRIEQNEAKFAGEREELLRLLGGWESLQSATPASIAAAGAGLGVPLPGSAAEAEELKRKKRKAEGGQPDASVPGGGSMLSNKQKAELKQAAFDDQHYIQRFDPNAHPSASKPPYPFLVGTPSTHPPVAPSPNNPSSSHGAYVRSTRLLVARATLQLRTAQTLSELSPPIGQRLVFPTAKNCEKWEGLLGAVTAGLELKKQLDTVDMELSLARGRLDAQAKGIPYEPPPRPATEASLEVPSAVPGAAAETS